MDRITPLPYSPSLRIIMGGCDISHVQQMAIRASLYNVFIRINDQFLFYVKA
jgi:hypothetical protein